MKPRRCDRPTSCGLCRRVTAQEAPVPTPCSLFRALMPLSLWVQPLHKQHLGRALGPSDRPPRPPGSGARSCPWTSRARVRTAFTVLPAQTLLHPFTRSFIRSFRDNVTHAFHLPPPTRVGVNQNIPHGSRVEMNHQGATMSQSPRDQRPRFMGR